MIAPEGKIIVIPIVILLFVGILLHFYLQIPIMKWVNLGIIILTVFCLYFFRDPVRTPDGSDNKFVSPADGKIVQILETEDTDLGKSILISIFLSVFNVHRQRAPFSSIVISSKYNPGKFLAAFNNKASSENEQTEIFFDAGNNQKYKLQRRMLLWNLLQQNLLQD